MQFGKTKNKKLRKLEREEQERQRWEDLKQALRNNSYTNVIAAIDNIISQGHDVDQIEGLNVMRSKITNYYYKEHGGMSYQGALIFITNVLNK